MAIDGSGLDNDATVKFRRDEVIYFGYLIWRKYIGDDCKFTVLRDGKEIVIDYKLRRYKRLVPRRIFDKLPTYYSQAECCLFHCRSTILTNTEAAGLTDQ